MSSEEVSIVNVIKKKYGTLARWQKNLIIICVISICTFWFLDLIDIEEWWHWNEWMEHIKNEHL